MMKSKSKKISSIKVGPFKAVKYYEADVTASDEWVNRITNIGKSVITNEEFFNIGVNHLISSLLKRKK